VVALPTPGKKLKGEAPDVAAILQIFFQKIRILGIVWSKFRVLIGRIKC